MSKACHGRVRVFLLALVCTTAPAVAVDDPAGRIIGAALTESGAYAKLAWLSDRIGHRLSGSTALDRAIEWAVAEFRRDGIDRVWTEPVLVPHWVRGQEASSIVDPVAYPMATLALGGSVATPEGGVTAEVVSVASLEELDALGQAVRGKIVLFNRPIRRNGGAEHGYGAGSTLRVRGPSQAARLGAVATLIRSLGTADFRLPHTGMLFYREDAPKIPAAAIAAEDAALIERLQQAGQTVRVRLELGCKTLPDAPSANVIAELPGRELPEEIVLIGAHLDTWDVGSGAHDDGAGIVVVMETLRLLRSRGIVPRRTIRAVLFTNEENGLRGGKAYAVAHRHEMDRHIVAIESDAGGGTPLGFGVSAGDGAADVVRRLAAPLAVIDAADVIPRGGGADISRMREYLVPQMSLRQDTTHYFDYHHTAADTLDKVDRHDLDRNVAAMAWMAYSLAERAEPLPRPTPGAFLGEIETVAFTAADGMPIAGSLALPAGAAGKSAAVILVHQGGSDRSEWDPFVRKLLANRFAVLAYDVRGHGRSGRVDDIPGLFDDPRQAPLDLRAAIDLLRSDERIDPRRIGVVGASIGSNLACVASATMDVKTAVALSGKTSAVYDLAGAETLELRSIFHVSSAGDQGGKRAAWARELYEKTDPPRRLDIVEGSTAHGVAIFADDPHLPDKIVEWLQRTL